MIGDVSGHGYQAALIMALTMSASAIHAQTTDRSGRDARTRSAAPLREELATTEMFISAFYARDRPRAASSCATRTRAIRTRSLCADGTLRAPRRRAIRRSAWTNDEPATVRRAVGSAAGSARAVHRRRQRRAQSRRRSAGRGARARHRSARTATKPPDGSSSGDRRSSTTHTGDAPRRDDLTIVLLAQLMPTMRAADAAHRGLPPIRKSLGQHFLNDRASSSASPTRSSSRDRDGGRDRTGAGSAHRAARAARRHARRDRDTIARSPRMLRERYASDATSTSSRRDVLTVDLAELAGGDVRLVGNVPYYITTPILFHALRAAAAGARRVSRAARGRGANRRASPARDEYGALSVNVQAVARRARSVPRSRRRVHSAAEGRERGGSRRAARRSGRAPARRSRSARSCRRAFGMRRKQMRRVLRDDLRRWTPRRAEAALSRRRQSIPTRGRRRLSARSSSRALSARVARLELQR